MLEVSYFRDEKFDTWEPLEKTNNYGYWAFPFSILEVKVDMAAVDGRHRLL